MAKWRRERGGVGYGSNSALLFLLLVPLLIVYGVWIIAAPSLSAAPGGGAGIPIPGKYMWYAPHSGFSNQVGELRNAVRVAAILGRILILPPVTDHHALSLGSCPKFRIVEPRHLRVAALSHFSDLVAQSRYYSIADVVNISAVSQSLVTTIDFRVFALLRCGANRVEPPCAGTATPCPSKGGFDRCIAMLNHAHCVGSDCVHCVDESCADTVWTYAATSPKRRLLEQPVKLKTKKFSGARRVKRDILQSLGDGTVAGDSKLLVFGSLFSGEYQGAQTHVDLSAASGNAAFDRVFQASQHFPLSRVVTDAGRAYIRSRMNKREFFCAQLRLLDGQFKNHWSKTFDSLRLRLESLVPDEGGGAIPVFVMTDLPRANWTGTYLQELSERSEYQIFRLEEGDEIVRDTARRVLALKPGSDDPLKVVVMEQQTLDQAPHHQMLPDILLYVEEAICSCASLGFHGTAGSTISEMITQLRNATPQCS
ncbi:hypothetical protein SELMODRAFT_80402 [Selaginella moellendorffii]|uniref:O-fucosyltransferase family protein n=2 Tax=Selaginella moellendorffii TaxID=88036 RepID=D8QXE6_SELML|nr:hypothetical protein SELMODRAFT_80402 [Selaginella moellendorffii]